MHIAAVREGSRQFFYWLMALTIALLAACGGPGDQVVPSAKSASMSISIDNASVDPFVASTATAILVDGAGKAVPGALITFSTDSNFGLLNPSAGTAVTDASGRAQIRILAGPSVGAASLTATYAPPGSTSTTTADTVRAVVNFNSKGGGSNSAPLPKLTVTMDSNVVGAASTTGATATLVGVDGRPMAGQLITFNTPPAFATFTPASGTAVTDSSGQARVALTAAKTAGGATLTASVNVTIAGTTPGTTLTTQVISTINYTGLGGGGNTPTSKMTVTLSPATIDQNTNANAVATLVNSTGQPLAGKLVTFTTDARFGVMKPALGTAVTDGSGQARITLLAGPNA
uniref:hypothetical protein n=1 Tax=Chitinimonas sp. TaxID=1934313 RepID=UPI0035ADB648